VLLHTVLIRQKAGVPSSEFDGLALQTATLAGRLCGPGNYDMGPNTTQEPLDQGYQFGFILRFADRDALAAYHADPEHELLSQRIQELAETVLVFDLET
jgi:stress responsive alpha/beta barrel protein